jgi:hypothetical protein
MVNLRRLIHDISNGRHLLTPETSPLPIRAATASKLSESWTKRRTPSASLNSTDGSAGRQKTISPSRKLLNMAEVLKVKSSPLALAQSLKSRSQSRTQSHSNNSLERPQPHSNEKLTKSNVNSHSSMNLTPLEAEPMPDTASSLALPLDVSLVQGVFSAIMSWGMDLSIDQLCMDKMGLMPPGRHVKSGIRG